MKTKTIGGISVAMAVIVMVLMCLLACCGCEPQPMPIPGNPPPSCNENQCPYEVPTPPPPLPQAPILDLPKDLRTGNYGGGSCMYAATIDILKQHGMFNKADQMRRNYRGGADVERIAGVLNKIGVDYAITTTGDTRFLDWCSRNGHGAAIHYYPNHAITFRGYSNGYAVLTNNNHPEDNIKVPKAEFQRKWKGYGGCAITVVASPNAPTPHF